MTREERNNAIKILRNFDLNNPKVNSVLFSAEEITNAFDVAIEALEQQPEDAISREDAINTLKNLDDLNGENVFTKNGLYPWNVLKELPSVQPKYNTSEWCHDCSEYDQDKHCCPRYNKVIRNTVEEIRQPKTHWISYWDEEARCYVYKCPECGNKQPFDTKHCWECGARLDVPDKNDGKLSEISTGSESEKT